MKIRKSAIGIWRMFYGTKIFYPQKVLRNKRVAIIGAADSAFDKENGDFIDEFDYVVRINKGPLKLTREKEKFLGKRSDILFHSFYENEISGGGPIDFEMLKKQGIKYIVNPNHNFKGWITHLNYFKRKNHTMITYLLSKKISDDIKKKFGKWIPTVGYSALYSILNAECKEVYITGFTFFKTPYADDYRDHFKKMENNNEHIRSQGIHNPDLEFVLFVKELEKHSNLNIRLDNRLSKIIKPNN